MTSKAQPDTDGPRLSVRRNARPDGAALFAMGILNNSAFWYVYQNSLSLPEPGPGSGTDSGPGSVDETGQKDIVEGESGGLPPPAAIGPGLRGLREPPRMGTRNST